VHRQRLQGVWLLDSRGFPTPGGGWERASIGPTRRCRRVSWPVTQVWTGGDGWERASHWPPLHRQTPPILASATHVDWLHVPLPPRVMASGAGVDGWRGLGACFRLLGACSVPAAAGVPGCTPGVRNPRLPQDKCTEGTRSGAVNAFSAFRWRIAGGFEPPAGSAGSVGRHSVHRHGMPSATSPHHPKNDTHSIPIHLLRVCRRRATLFTAESGRALRKEAARTVAGPAPAALTSHHRT
jgi:hypothetical protein